MHAAISQDRQEIAVAGTRGLAVYSRRARRWRLFGDATQERLIRVGCVGGWVSGTSTFSCVVQRSEAVACASAPRCRRPPLCVLLAFPHLASPPCPPPPHPSNLANQVHGLMWLAGGVIAAVAHVEGAGRGQEAASPQLLLYPQHHLDSASLLARMPLQQVRGSDRCCGLTGGRAAAPAA